MTTTNATQSRVRRGGSAGARPAVTEHRRAGRAVATAPWLLMAPFLLLFALTFLLPILVAIVQSFTSVTRHGIFGELGVTTTFAGFHNYALALQNANFISSILRMLLFGVVQVSVMIALCTVLALLLESASARWPAFFRAAYFMPYGVPGVIATILWSFLYVPGLSPIIDVAHLVGLQPDFLGQSTVLWSIANIVTWSYTGYNMLIIVAQLKTIPGEVYEAAKVDGATGWHVVRHIQLPLIRPALVLTTVFSIIGTLQLFAEPQVLQTISPAINSEYTPNLSAYTIAFAYNRYNVAAAEAVLIALVAFVLSFAFLRLTNRSSQ